MDKVVAALEKEIKQLDDNIRLSLEICDKTNNFIRGQNYRAVAKLQKESYQRLLKDITDGQ